MKRKLLYITITYIIGIIWGLYFNINIVPFCIIHITIIIILLTKRKFFIIVLECVIIISYLNTVTIKKIYDDVVFDNTEVAVSGTIVKRYENDQQNYKKYLIKINLINKNCKYKNLYMYVYDKDINRNLAKGMNVEVNGIFEKGSKSRNFNGFNYDEYLRSERIIGIINCDKVYITGYTKYSLFDNIHKNIKEKIYKFLPEDKAHICSALILGDKDLISDEVIEYFSESSLSYALAISGMHISYIIMCFSILLYMLGEKNKNIILCCILIFYNAIIGYQISVIRATIMTIIHIIGLLIYKKSDSITNLSLSALIILIINPYSIKSFSFMFSFGGTLGILLFYKKVDYFLVGILPRKCQIKIFNFIRKSISLSISANIAILPIMVYCTNKVSIIFIISGIVVNILLSIIIPLILVSIVLSLISIQISEFLSSILGIFLDLLIFFSKFFSNKIFNIYVITPYKFSIITYYILTGLILFKLNSEKKVKHIINSYIKKVLVIYVMFITMFNIFGKFDKSLNIFFIDVGQGDSTLIITENNKNILIDSGGTEFGEDKIGKNTLLPYLYNRRIYKLDYVMISHFDSDHCKAMLYIMEHMKVKNAIISKQEEISENYNEFLKIVNEKKINIIVVGSGMKINIDKSTYFDVIWPNANNVINENILNNNSIVTKLVYGNFSMLFTGDIEKIAEQNIINKYDVTADIIKIPHHGSKTSSSLDFIKCVNPKIALIGVGKNNKFGHPSGVTIKSLETRNCMIYRTDLDGEIKININRSGKIRIRKHIY